MRNPKDKKKIIADCDFFYTEGSFSNSNPIHLEIGMGKGQFLLNMALKYPNINFIGVEKYSAVAALAIKKIKPYQLPNLKILIMDAIDLPNILKNKIACIYLNFSDPWPKKRHTKRRLTSPVYLDCYANLFQTNATIIQKTDNDEFFKYSLFSLKENGYEINKVSYDLSKENIDNVMTEYEEKFRNKGIKIKYLYAFKPLKKIIFDLDNTLIKFDKDKFLLTYAEVLKKHNIPKTSEELYDVINKYEETMPNYDINQLHEFIAQNFQIKLPEGFIKDLCWAIGKKWVYEGDETLKSTLNYLKSKYDLYVLTNFFTDVQTRRLEKMALLKYFKAVVGAEKFIKPNPLAFHAFFQDCAATECLMIGDSLEHDILPAEKLGMKTILFTKYSQIKSSTTLQIASWQELKNILEFN